jgi:hypothetical protein
MASPVVRGIYFVRLHFDAGLVAWHSGFGDIWLDGVPYQGAGTLSSVSVVKEEPGIKAAGVSVGMSGIPEEIVALALGQQYINRKAYVHFTPLDDGDQPVIAAPVLLFRGTMDSINGTMGSNAGFTITLKSRLADWERPRKVLYSDVEQQQLYPGDRGMEYMAQLSQKKIIWPRAAFLPDPRD